MVISPRMLALLQLFLFSSFPCSPSLPFFASASSSTRNSNYNVYQYDRTTPQFTPDGRLLQVEYASTAADMSPPLVVVEYTSSDGSAPDYPFLIMLTIPRQAMSPQQRIVIVDGDDGAFGKDGFCLAMSGSLADSLALLQVGLKRSAQHRLRYGSDAPVGMAALTRALADECQSRVMGGGLRPYGSTLLLCGYGDGSSSSLPSRSDSSGERRNQRAVIYQTDPSGGILQHSPPTVDAAAPSASASTPFVRRKYRDDVTAGIVTSEVRCIVGGSPSLQRQLHRRIQQGATQMERGGKLSPSTEGQRDTTLAQRIAHLAKILIKETEGKFGARRGSGFDAQDDTSSSVPCPLEVVVVSSRNGCYRLDEAQIRYIQKIMDDIP